MGKRKRNRLLKHATIATRVPPSVCPRCQTTLTAATGLAARREDTIPHPGALSLCDRCGTWLVFMEDLHLRLATQEEIEAVAPEVRREAKKIGAFLDTLRPKQ